MRMLFPLSLIVVSFFALSCSRPTQPSIPIEAELHVRAKDPSSTCTLSGRFHVPRVDVQNITGGTDWKGTATIAEDELVVVTAGVVGTETWSCEMECSIRKVGDTVATTHKAFTDPSRPAPTCPSGRSVSVTCVYQAWPPKK